MNDLEKIELKNLIDSPPDGYPADAIEKLDKLLSYIELLERQLKVARANAIKLPSGVTVGGFVSHTKKPEYGKGKVVGLKYEADLKMELVEVWWFDRAEKTAVPPDRLIPYEE